MPITLSMYAEGGVEGEFRPTMSGIGLILNAWADAAATIPVPTTVFQVSVTPRLPGWVVASSNNNTDLNGLQWAAVYQPGVGPFYSLPVGKVPLVDVVIEYTDPTPLPQYYLTIKRSINPVDTSTVIFDKDGNDFFTSNSQWDSRPGFADTQANIWAFSDWGNPGWSRTVRTDQGPVEVGQTTPSPLILLTPEPASLVLLAFGGMALGRRRM